MSTELEAGTVEVVILSGGGEVAGDHRVQRVHGRWNVEGGQVKSAGDVMPEGVEIHGDSVRAEVVDFTRHYQVIHEDFVLSGSGGFLQVEVKLFLGPGCLVVYEREHLRRRGN